LFPEALSITHRAFGGLGSNARVNGLRLPAPAMPGLWRTPLYYSRLVLRAPHPASCKVNSCGSQVVFYGDFR
jgi:hypothetical protein